MIEFIPQLCYYYLVATKSRRGLRKEGKKQMHNILMIIMAIISVVLIVAILMQEGNSAGLSGSIAGGAEQLFGKKRARGYEGILRKTSTVCAVLYIILAVVIVALE